MGDAHHCSGLPISEMTYTVSSGTLNPSIPYHTTHSTILTSIFLREPELAGCPFDLHSPFIHVDYASNFRHNLGIKGGRKIANKTPKGQYPVSYICWSVSGRESSHKKFLLQKPPGIPWQSKFSDVPKKKVLITMGGAYLLGMNCA